MADLPQVYFERYDDSADERFYDLPRFVTHIDNDATAAVTQLYRDLFRPGARSST